MLNLDLKSSFLDSDSVYPKIWQSSYPTIRDSSIRFLIQENYPVDQRRLENAEFALGGFLDVKSVVNNILDLLTLDLLTESFYRAQCYTKLSYVRKASISKEILVRTIDFTKTRL
jgi:hypothetical protein